MEQCVGCSEALEQCVGCLEALESFVAERDADPGTLGNRVSDCSNEQPPMEAEEGEGSEAQWQ